MPATWKRLAYADEVVLDTEYSANSILASVAANAPAAVVVGEQTLVGRITGGNIAALTPANVRTMLNVLEGGGMPTTANATTRGALTPALADMVFQVDTLETYVCTVIA
jgi:hypothetical protein